MSNDTDTNTALQTVWDYMLLGHELQKSDIIFALGSHDPLVGKYAAQLWLDGWAPYLVCAGSGTVNQHNPAWSQFVGTTEAELFADLARELGVPDEVILIENQSQNTGQNYEFTEQLLNERGIEVQQVIAVQKPYMERRTYATGKVWWPNKELIISSPSFTLQEYTTRFTTENDHWIHAMVGDLQRIHAYPAKGFQIEQPIPDEVWRAYETLVAAGYTKCLIQK